MSCASLKDLSLRELWELFPVILEPYKPVWKEWAADEIAYLKEIIDDDSIGIIHIGSTAIPGIYAKPIIDILVMTPDSSEWARYSDLLEERGYICMASDVRRMSFNKGYSPEGYLEKVFHIHFHLLDDRDEILFRDYLCSHPDRAKEYEALKLSLLPEFRNDRDGYTMAKSEFIYKILELAKQG